MLFRDKNIYIKKTRNCESICAFIFKFHGTDATQATGQKTIYSIDLWCLAHRAKDNIFFRDISIHRTRYLAQDTRRKNTAL